MQDIPEKQSQPDAPDQDKGAPDKLTAEALELKDWKEAFSVPEKISQTPSQKLIDDAVSAGKASKISKALTPIENLDGDLNGTVSAEELKSATYKHDVDALHPLRGLATPRTEFSPQRLSGSAKPFTSPSNPPILPPVESLAKYGQDLEKAQILNSLSGDEAAQEAIRKLTNDTVKENDPPGISKYDLAALDKYVHVKEGLQFLSDHLSRIDSDDDKVLSHGEIEALAKDPHLIDEKRISILKALNHLRSFDLSWHSVATKQAIDEEIKRIPDLPKLAK